MSARSEIHITDEVANADPAFGANSHYVRAWLVLPDGQRRALLFTEHQILTARERARSNPEDTGAPPGYWRRLWWALRG